MQVAYEAIDKSTIAAIFQGDADADDERIEHAMSELDTDQQAELQQEVVSAP
jgi:hypothetical protein